MLSIVLFVIVFSLMVVVVEDGGASSGSRIRNLEVEEVVSREKGVVEQIVVEVENVLVVGEAEAGAGVLVEIGAGAEGQEKEDSRLLDRNGNRLKGAALINRKKKLGIE